MCNVHAICIEYLLVVSLISYGCCFSFSRKMAWSVAVLCPVLGIAWLFGVLSISSKWIGFQYIFTIANAFQVDSKPTIKECSNAASCSGISFAVAYISSVIQ